MRFTGEKHQGIFESRSFGWIVALILAVVPLGACTDGARSSSGESDSTKAISADSSDLPRGDDPVQPEADDFSTRIDNPYWPMKPGTRWTFREVDEDGTTLEVVVTVTSLTKKLANGVTARVVRDTVTENGELIEDTNDWYAQDAEGNIWYLGEDTAEFEDGKITTRAGSWEAGVDGALPGILIPADPEPGMKYRQEYLKGEAEDNGEVLSVEEMAEVPFGQFDGCLLTKDTVALEPDVLEYKLYARRVGPVLVLGVSGGAGREELVDRDRVPRRVGTGPLGSPRL